MSCNTLALMPVCFSHSQGEKEEKKTLIFSHGLPVDLHHFLPVSIFWFIPEEEETGGSFLLYSESLKHAPRLSCSSMLASSSLSVLWWAGRLIGLFPERWVLEAPADPRSWLAANQACKLEAPGEDEDCRLAMHSMPWMASWVLGEAGASLGEKEKGSYCFSIWV